jgi:adenylate kinase
MDDNERTVARRLEAYFGQTMPLIRHYEATGRLHRINGDQPIKKVTKQIVAVLAAAHATGETDRSSGPE